LIDSDVERVMQHVPPMNAAMRRQDTRPPLVTIPNWSYYDIVALRWVI